MVEQLQKLKITELFSDDAVYEIPLYQRAFAWEKDEIEQLIDDINDFEEDSYYLGTLVVHGRGENHFEVIDGQQRLTALFLLFKCLGRNIKDSLTFDCREKSNATLKNFDYAEEEVDNNLIEKKDYIATKLRKVNLQHFAEQLEKVLIFRIEVPPHTDLNRYFEIMNTRGMQLEQHDILKAKLMDKLSSVEEQDRFALIWDACADMSGYVQMHFSKAEREKLFSQTWNDFSDMQKLTVSSSCKERVSISEAIKTTEMEEDKAEDNNSDDDSVEYNSIIRFPYFLLHVLRVYVKNENGGLVDDQKLLVEFDNYLEGENFANEFIVCLLKCRLLFDKYIIKRHRSTEDWTLRELVVNDSGRSRQPQYKDTIATSKNILMMQVCLRVSYTSPKVMHWITKLLIWLYQGNDISAYEQKVESFIAKEVKQKYLDVPERNEMGVDTPHLVFNYLDYLLWLGDSKYEKFKFESRNSVEHWYPQHPREFPRWDDKSVWGEDTSGLNSLGNLCLVTVRTNSRFSDLRPIFKKGIFAKTIASASPKLQLMAECTTDDDMWRRQASAQHGKEMQTILEERVALYHK